MARPARRRRTTRSFRACGPARCRSARRTARQNRPRGCRPALRCRPRSNGCTRTTRTGTPASHAHRPGRSRVSRSAAPFALQLGFDHGRRSASRLSSAIVRAIADGQLADGDVVPSTRMVAASLGIARSVVVEAYGELTAAGFFATRTGGGTWVEQGASRAARAGALASTAVSPGAGPPPRPTPGPEPQPAAVLQAEPSAEPRTRPEFDLRPGMADTTL